MSFTKRVWTDPIKLDASNINRLEQGVKNSFDNIEIMKEEVLSLQLNNAKLNSKVSSLLANSPTVLKTLTDITTILNSNTSILDTLKDTSNFLTKTSQTLTLDEIKQVQKNLGINKFLHLTDIKLNDISIVNGSEINIKLPLADTKLNKDSLNSIANKTVVEELNKLKTSIKYTDIINAPSIEDIMDHTHDHLYSRLTHNHDTKYSLLNHIHKNYADSNHTHSDLLSRITSLDTEMQEVIDIINNNSNYATIEYVDNNSSKIDKVFLNKSLLPIVDKTININIPTDLKDFTNTPKFISEQDAKNYTDTAISDLINGAPTTLNTLKELSDAFESNKALIQLLDQSIGSKANKNHLHTITDITNINTLALKDHTHSYIDILDLDNVLKDYSKVSHTHDIYALTKHTHTQTEINGLSTTISNTLTSAKDYTDDEITKLSESIEESLIHDHDNSYLKLSGGTMIGNLILQNNIRLQALNSKAVAKDILRYTASDNIILGNPDGILAVNTILKPTDSYNKTLDLGTSTALWKDLYLSGNLVNGTNQIAVADIANKVHSHTKSEITDFSHTHTFSDLTNISKYLMTLSPYGTRIPANTDINTIDYIKVGNYYCSDNASVNTLTNCPTTAAFMMRVYSPLGTTIDNELERTWCYRLRELTNYQGETYRQLVYSDDTIGNFTYTNWIKLSTSTDLMSYSKTTHTHNYLPLTGGTLSGNLTITHNNSGDKKINIVNNNGGYDTCYYAERTDTGIKTYFGIGSSGINHGIYTLVSEKKDNNGNVIRPSRSQWVLYSTETDTFLKGRADRAISDQHSNVIDTTYLKLSGGTITGNFTTNNGVKIPKGQGVKLDSTNNVEYMLYGDGASTNLFTQIRKTDGSYGYAKLLDIDGNLYSNNKLVAIKEDLNNYLPLTGGTLSDTLSIKNTSSHGKLILGSTDDSVYIRGNQTNQLYLVATNGIILRNGGDSSDKGVLFGSTDIRPEVTETKNLGTASIQWNNMYAKTIYQNGEQVANKGDLNNYLPLTGGTMTGAINMNNCELSNVGHIKIADPGTNEGIEWAGGNGWRIYEAPNDLSNAQGNLQFVASDTRRMTIDTSGIIEANGFQGRLKGTDTRNVNSAPSVYQTPINTISEWQEFKSTSTVGASAASNDKNFVYLKTYVPWGDSSGGLPTQLAIGDHLAFRKASSSSAWGSWLPLLENISVTARGCSSAVAYADNTGTDVDDKYGVAQIGLGNGSKLVIQGGARRIGANTTGSVTFNVPLTGIIAYGCQLHTNQTSNEAAFVRNISNTQMTIYQSNSGKQVCTWFVIGVV